MASPAIFQYRRYIFLGITEYSLQVWVFVEEEGVQARYERFDAAAYARQFHLGRRFPLVPLKLPYVVSEEHLLETYPLPGTIGWAVALFGWGMRV